MGAALEDSARLSRGCRHGEAQKWFDQNDLNRGSRV